MNRIQYTFFLILIILMGISCERKNEAKKNVTTDKKNTEDKHYVAVTVNNSRVRSTPDLDGAVLERVREESVLEYMKDSTTFTTQVRMEGKTVEKPWYKVKTELGNEGWVSGVCIVFLSSDENRRILALREDAAVSTDNGKSKTTIQEAPVIDKDVIDRFKTMINQLEAADPSALPKAISLYESAFQQKPSSTADLAFAEVLTLHKRILQHYQGKVNLSAYQSLSAEIKNYGSPNMEIDATTRLLETNGLTFGLKKNGQVYLRDNADYLLRRFLRLVSPKMQQFLEQYAIENESPVLDGSNIVIPITELAAYTVFWDKFSSRFPHFALKEKVAELRKTYAGLLLNGTDNNPAFKEAVLSNNFREAYKVMTTQMGISPLIKSMLEYYQALEAEKFKDDKKAAALRSQILSKL